MLRGAALPLSGRLPFRPRAPGDGEDAAGVVLAPDGSIAFADEVAAAWMDELGGNGAAPPVATAVAAPARTVAAGLPCDGRIARARAGRAGGVAARACLGARRRARAPRSP